jgi:hypothetical protein
MTAGLLNEWLGEREEEAMSYGAVQRYVASSEVIDMHKRATKKSGKDDVESSWAKARLAQCLQLKVQLTLAAADDFVSVSTHGHGTRRAATAASARPFAPLFPLYLDGMGFCDESHFKVRLGHAGKWEVLVARHPDTGLPCSVQDGGVFPDAMPSTNVKFPGEARGCFVVAMKKKAGDAGYEGMKAPPFCYTGKNCLGVESWEKELKREDDRVKALKGGREWGTEGQGYEFRYGASWKTKLEEAVGKKFVCVTVIMDYVIDSLTEMYAGTDHADDFVIFHDALSQWWEAGAQKHMEKRGFKDRQVRCLGDVNRDNRYYKEKLVGDSPELMRGLDAFGFADLAACLRYNVAMTSSYAVDDARRFKTGTPSEMWDSVTRAWEIAPTSERLVQDILALPRYRNGVEDNIDRHSVEWCH